MKLQTWFSVLTGLTSTIPRSNAAKFDTQIIDLVVSLTETFNLENMFIFKKDPWDCERLDKLRNTPVAIFNTQSKSEFITLFSTNSLAIVFITNGLNDSILTAVDGTLRGMHTIKTLFVFSEFKEINDFFQEWAFRRGFVYAKAVFPNHESMNIFGYNPFFDETSNDTATPHLDLFPNQMKNLNNYMFKTPLLFDAPRIFKYTRWNGKVIRSGLGLHVMSNFIRSRHGIFREVKELNTETKTVNMNEVFNSIDSGVVEIAANLYGFIDRSKYAASNAMVTQMCVMVPIKTAKYWRMKYIFGGSWSAAFIALGEFAAMFALLTVGFVISQNKKYHRQYGKALLSAYALILNLPPPVRWPNDLRSALISVPIMCMCLLWSNIYYGELTSFLSHSRKVKQIETVEDFIAHRQPIMVPDYERDMFLAGSNFPQKFKDLVIGVDVDNLTKYRLALNQTYAYGLSTERWQFLLYQQDYLNLPLFRVTSTCFFNYLLAFPIRYDSPFREELDMYILETTEKGFWQYWYDKTLRDATYAKIVTRRRSEDDQEMVGMRVGYPKAMWLLFVVGYSTSCAVFMVEKLVFLLKTK